MTADILSSLGVEFIVVGGQAVLLSYQRTTGDVDVMVTTSRFDQTVAILREDPRFEFRGSSDMVAQFFARPLGGMGLDVLDPSAFSGKLPGGAFYDFLVKEESTLVNGVRFATVDAVWYTRLMVDPWETYSERIVADIAANASPRKLVRVREIAQRFGTDAKLQPRIARVLDDAKHADYPDFRGAT